MKSSPHPHRPPDSALGIGDTALQFMAEHAVKGCFTVIPAFDHHGAFTSLSLVCARVRAKKEFGSYSGKILIFGPNRTLNCWTNLQPGRLTWHTAN